MPTLTIAFTAYPDPDSAGRNGRRGTRVLLHESGGENDQDQYPAEDAAAAKSRSQPEDAKQTRREAHADAATRLDHSDARLGAALSGENRPSNDTETADALKRAAENERRS